MWSLLWILPPLFLVWAIVLVIKKVRQSGAKEPEVEDEQETVQERIRKAMEEPGDGD